MLKEGSIISALIGLAGACGSNPKTDNTDGVILRALAAPLLNPALDETAVRHAAEEVHAEKNAVAPGCASCPTPCGNTSDYDMERLYGAAAEVREAKLRLLQALERAAVRMLTVRERQADLSFFYKGLSFLGYDAEAEYLLALADQAERLAEDHEKEASL